MVENRSLGKNYLKFSPQNQLNSFDFCVKWLIRTKTSKTEVLQTPSAIKSKPRSGGRVVKVFEFLKNVGFLKSYNQF